VCFYDNCHLLEVQVVMVVEVQKFLLLEAWEVEEAVKVVAEDAWGQEALVEEQVGKVVDEDAWGQEALVEEQAGTVVGVDA
jgi:hypothetical protein